MAVGSIKMAHSENVKPGANPKKNAFEDLLNVIDVDEYKAFIRQYALNDKYFKTKFELFFSDKMDNPDLEKKYGDFGYELFAVYHNLAKLLGRSAEFLNFIDTQSSKLTGKYDEYKREFFQKEKIDFYRETGRDKEAEELILQNLDIVEVRQAEVDKAFDRNDFVAAKQLLADGIKLAEEKQHLETVFQWEKEFLRIAVAENDVKTVRRLTRSFIFDRDFDKNYFRQWKQTFPETEQKDAVESLIAERINEAKQEHSKHKSSY
jgi:hypothetical protein